MSSTTSPHQKPGSLNPWFERHSSNSPNSPSDGDNQDLDAGLSAKERRREQVRRAQRTHRDRKATYVKALEMEVAKLRAKDAHASEDLRQAQVIIQRLQNLLAQYAIPIDPSMFEVGNANMATIELVGRPPFGQSLSATLPVFDHSAPAPHISSSTSSQTLTSAGGLDVPMVSAESDDIMAAKMKASATSPKPTHPAGLDSTQVGINFVLALEHPCLYHHSIPSVPMLAHGNLGTGHSLMVSSPIMEHSPHYSLNPIKMGWPKGATWEVPAVELEKLLSFSDQIELEGEITPVQVWNRIKNHEKFDKMTPQLLEALRNLLLPKVKCLGFGAIIEQSFFEEHFESAMSNL